MRITPAQVAKSWPSGTAGRLGLGSAFVIAQKHAYGRPLSTGETQRFYRASAEQAKIMSLCNSAGPLSGLRICPIKP
jgi:hypothetical protein